MSCPRLTGAPTGLAESRCAHARPVGTPLTAGDDKRGSDQPDLLGRLPCVPGHRPSTRLVARFLHGPAGCPAPARRRATMTTAHQERSRPEAPLELQLKGYRLATAEILYRMPDHPSLLQTFIWQHYDLAPTSRSCASSWPSGPKRSRADCSASASVGPRSSPLAPTPTSAASGSSTEPPRHAAVIAS